MTLGFDCRAFGAILVEGRLAQLVRALVSHTKGQGFESLTAQCEGLRVSVSNRAECI